MDPGKTKIEKSTMYPSYALNDCVEFVRLIDKLGGKVVAESTLLSTLKLSSRNTRTYSGKLSSSKQFGLVEARGSSLEVTDYGRRILYPTEGEGERQRLLLGAFLNPDLYTRLVERFDKKQLPSQDLLANLLMNEYRISKVAKDRAAKVFFDSAKYVGVLSKDNFLDVSEAVEPPQEEVKETKESDEQAFSGSTTGTQSIKVTLSGGTTGMITVPNTITKKDVERLKKILDLLVVEEE